MERRDSAKENINPLKYMEDLNADMSVDSLAPELTEPMPKEQATPNIPEKEQLITDELDNNENDLASESIDLSRSLGPALVGTSSFETTPTAQASSSDRTQSPQVKVESSLSSGSVSDPEPAGILGDVTNQQKPFIVNEDSVGNAATTVLGHATDAQLSGDSSQSGGQNTREAEEYADDLARELINDTNELVRLGHSVDQVGSGENKKDWGAAQEEEETSKEEANASEAEGADARSGTTESGYSESIVAKNTNNATIAEQEKDSQDHSSSAAGAAAAAMVVDEMEEPDTTQQRQRDYEVEIEPELEREAELVSRTEIEDIETIEEPEIIENQQEDEEEEAPPPISSSKRQSSVNSETFDGHKLPEGLPKEEQDSSVAKLVNKTSNTTNVFDAHQSFQTAVGNSLIDCDSRLLDEMEFTKNYSDDLMGRNDGSEQQDEIPSSGADLADFELPPYSGSSSGSEQPPKQHSPTKRKSSSSSAQQASSSQHVSVAPPNLAAVKSLLLSSYSRVSHVFHWKKPIESGVFFAIGITLITALTFFSIISVVAYTALGAIFASSLIRVYKAIMKTLKRSQETPFDQIWDKILSLNVSMSPEKMHELVDISLGNFNASLVYFKQVLLVEDKFATLKFGLFLYILTYIGSYFNGMTLITISYLALFSVPVFYEKNKANIDEYLNLVTGQISTTASLITNKVSSLVFGSSPVPSTSGIKKQE